MVAENRGGGGGDSSQVSNLRNGRLGSLLYADNSETRPRRGCEWFENLPREKLVRAVAECFFEFRKGIVTGILCR